MTSESTSHACIFTFSISSSTKSRSGMGWGWDGGGMGVGWRWMIEPSIFVNRSCNQNKLVGNRNIRTDLLPACCVHILILRAHLCISVTCHDSATHPSSATLTKHAIIMSGIYRTEQASTGGQTVKHADRPPNALRPPTWCSAWSVTSWFRYYRLEAELAEINWRVKWEDIMFGAPEKRKMERSNSRMSLVKVSWPTDSILKKLLNEFSLNIGHFSARRCSL